MRYLFLAVWIIIFIPNNTNAQDSSKRKIHNMETLENVEVLGKAATQALDALDHQLIHKESLLNLQGNTLMHSLASLPGISSIQTGSGIAKPVIRGMSMNRVIVNEYGIKQENQQWGLDHGLEIDQYNVEQVEIIKGPVSLLYGSDGVGGVLQIQPPRPPIADTTYGDLIINYKSNNDLIGGSGKWVWSRDRWYVMARMSYQDYGLCRVPADSFNYNTYRLPIYGRKMKNTAGNEWSNSIYLGFRSSKWQSNIYISNVRQKAGFFPGAFGIPRLYQLQPSSDPRSIGLPSQYINHFKFISNTQLFTNHGIVKLDIGYQFNIRKELSRPHAHGNGVVPQGTMALALYLHTLQSNLRWEHQLANWHFQSGVSLQYQLNDIAGYEFLIPEYRQFQSGVYTYAQYKADNGSTLSGGIRYDFATQNAQQGTVEIYDTTGQLLQQQERSPSLHKVYNNLSGALGWKYEMNHNWIVSANLGSAYRIPLINELLSNGVHHGTFRHELGDSMLDPERGWMIDFGADYHNHIWHWSFTPFFNYFSNYIYLHPSARFSPLPEAGQIYQFGNTSAIYAGAEILIDYPVWKDIYMLHSFEYVYNKNLETQRGLPFTPPMSILTEVSWKPNKDNLLQEGFECSISGHYFAAQHRVDYNEPVTDGYFLVDASASWKRKIGAQYFSVFIRANNLLDSYYLNNMSRYRILNLPEQGINFQLLLRYEF